MKLKIENLSVIYRDGARESTALRGVSFSVEAGEFIAIVGASGCGKSTLLSVIGGLLAATEGQVLIDDKPAVAPGKDRSMVFQHYSLFPWLTARSNVAFGIKQSAPRLSRRERFARADLFLTRVGLGKNGDCYPKQLSGGMRQRVAIARALAMDTDIILMDEPFGAVDAKNRALLQDLLLDLWEKTGCDDTVGVAPIVPERKTIVFVTHDIDEALFLADRILVFGANPGRIVREINVNFPRPRWREKLTTDQTYTGLRRELLTLLFDENESGEGI